MTVVTNTEVRNNFKSILDRVADDAAVMSLEYFNAIQETLHLLSTPANVKHLERSIAQYRKGEIESHELIDE